MFINTYKLHWFDTYLEKNQQQFPVANRAGTEDAPAGELQVCDALSLQMRLGGPRFSAETEPMTIHGIGVYLPIHGKPTQNPPFM